MGALAAVRKRWTYMPPIGGGGLQPRKVDEDLRTHLAYCAESGGFGVQVVAADVLALLDRVEALEAEVRTLTSERG